uniref:kelch-like protein 30 n=1 Tax=Styela clava TaxID=7725 RepID=UPI0019398DEB|nr:kelch-like protein 30 [Styela clava]
MDTLVYSELPNHAIETLQGLNEFRREFPEYCDFTLIADNKNYPCHRSVLCYHSEYFRAMVRGNFLENGANVTTLGEVNSDSLSAILDFLYTGRIEINQTSVETLLETATRFQFQKVIDICVSYLRHQIDETNSLEMYNFGKCRAIPELAEAAKHFTYERLESVFDVSDVIKHMTPHDVEEILQDKLAHFCGEEQRIMSILKWTNFDKADRMKEMEKLLQNINWSRLSTKFILRTLLYYPLVVSNKSTKDLIIKKVRKVLDDVINKDSSSTEISSHSTTRGRWRIRNLFPDRCLGGENQGCMQEVLLLIGGLTLGEAERGDFSQPNVMCYVPRTRAWEIRANWPERKLRGFSVSRFHNNVIVTGGCDFIEMKRYNIKRGWIYEVESDKWERLNDMIYSRSFHSSCQVNGELYVVGGAFNTKIDMEVFRHHGQDWTAIKNSAPKFVWNFAVAPCNGKVILVGSGETSPTLVLQCYNPAIAQWSQFRSPNVPRHLSSVLCTTSQDGSQIFVTGDNSQKVFMFNPNANEWSRAQDMLNLHSNGGMTTIGEQIYLTGGHFEEGEYLDQMESYDVKSGLWTSNGPLPYLWLYHTCIPIMCST